ncbi:MAG: DegV family protein [Christensenellales bacterium]|jgi:DegV family protein with EDD domain
MRKVKIVTDSTCDLPFDMLAQREITLVPMHVILGEQSYLDDGTLDSRELFRFADSTGVLPKSAAINAFEFETIFRRLLDEDYDIFFLGISSRLSSTMQNAVTAANNIGAGERISIVDSLSLSTGVGLQVLEASDMALAGASLTEITRHAESIRGKVQASFVVDTLKYLYMGGRCSKLASIVGSRLQIKPKLELIDGYIVPTQKFRGSRFVDKYYEQVMERAADVDPKRVFVTHCLSDEAENVNARLEKDFGFENVMVTNASATISTHCGPGTIGILFIYK